MTKGFDDLTCPNDSKNLCQSQTDRKTDKDNNKSVKKAAEQKLYGWTQ